MTSSGAKLRRRGPPPGLVPNEVMQQHLLARIERTVPSSGAAKLLHDALNEEVWEK